MYQRQIWNNGTRLDATRLNHIEEGIYNCSKEIENVKADKSCVNEFVSVEAFNELNKLCIDMLDKIEKQKKEITALKTKITKLAKKSGDDDK